MMKYRIRKADGTILEHIGNGPLPEQPEWGRGWVRLEPEDLDAPAKAARRAIIRTANKNLTLPELKDLVAAMAQDLGYEVDP